MDWTTILLLKLAGGLMAMALAYAICVSVEEIVAASKKSLAFIRSFHSAHFHHA